MSEVYDNWHVRVGGESYGPYSHDLMARFVAEGRVTDATEISADPAQGWFAAARYPQFPDWQVEAQRPTGQSQQLQYAQPQHTQALQHTLHDPKARAASAGPVTRHMVLAELRSGNAMSFLRVVQGYMQCTRIGDTVWLVDGAGDTEALTHALRASLGAADRLFVADITGQPTGQAGFQQASRVG